MYLTSFLCSFYNETSDRDIFFVPDVYQKKRSRSKNIMIAIENTQSIRFSEAKVPHYSELNYDYAGTKIVKKISSSAL